MSAALPALDETALEAELATGGPPLVIDFWAEWCPPCRAMVPVLERLALELGGQARFSSVNADQHPQMAGRFGVMGLPTLVVLSQGRVAARILGYRGPLRLASDLKRALSLPPGD